MDIVFGEKWFEKYQRRLLWLLNTPIIGVWFRYVMRIHIYDCYTLINRITPNSISYGAKIIGDKIHVTTDFRTHNKFSKRLYHAFKPLWYLLHIFDLVALDRFKKLSTLSFGFNTLPVYPDAHTETTSVDGRLTVSGKTDAWATLIAEAGVSASDTVADETFVQIVATSTTDRWSKLQRSMFLFDTHDLTSDATISSAVFSLFGSFKQDTQALGINMNVYASSPASNTAIAASDFQSFGTTAFCDTSIDYTAFSTTGYNDFSLNASGLGAISKTSITKLGTKNATWDNGATSPTWSSLVNMYLEGKFADNTGTNTDPKLVITFTLPASANTTNFFQFI